MAARVGKAKAITATARKLALLVFKILRDPTPYSEVPADSYNEQQRFCILRGFCKRTASFGFELVDFDDTNAALSWAPAADWGHFYPSDAAMRQIFESDSMPYSLTFTYLARPDVEVGFRHENIDNDADLTL